MFPARLIRLCIVCRRISAFFGFGVIVFLSLEAFEYSFFNKMGDVKVIGSPVPERIIPKEAARQDDQGLYSNCFKCRHSAID